MVLTTVNLLHRSAQDREAFQRRHRSGHRAIPLCPAEKDKVALVFIAGLVMANRAGARLREDAVFEMNAKCSRPTPGS